MKLDNSSLKINFVTDEKLKWPELFEQKDYDEEDLTSLLASERLGTNDACWVISTFLKLKIRGCNVNLCDALVPGEICVLTAGAYYREKSYYNDSFIIGARGDCSRPELPHITICQNKIGVKSSKDRYIPLWPQPGIIPRNIDRGNKIETIVFKGAELASEFRSDMFRKGLQNRGVELIIEDKREKGFNWHDYSKADLVLAIRDHYAIAKPASKLVNSWLAGVPAILGTEPAYLEQRKSELDYIEANTPEEVLAAVDKLKSDASLYMRMRENAKLRGKEFEDDKIIDIWLELLYCEVPEKFYKWKQLSKTNKRLRNKIRIAKQLYVWKKEDLSRIIISVIKKFSNGRENRLTKSVFFWGFR